MPGPPPKPTAIKILEGNPGKQKLNEADMLAPREPEPPEWLSAEGRAVWDSLVGPMMGLGILQDTDGFQLAQLCDAQALLLEARAALLALPLGKRLLVQGANHLAKENPLIAIVNKQREIVHRLCVEFGMTPASRSRVLNGESIPIPEKERGRTLEEIVNAVPMTDRFAEPPKPN